MSENNNNFTPNDGIDGGLNKEEPKSQLYVTRDYSGVEVSIPIESKEKEEEKQYFFNPDILDSQEANSSYVEEKRPEIEKEKKKKKLFWFSKKGEGHS